MARGGGKGRHGVFTGEYEHSLDEKGRVVLPARFRGRLEELVLAKGLAARCLHVYPPDEFNRISERLKEAGGKARDVSRFFYSGANEQTLDKQGRLGIPETLRRYAGLARDLTIIGANTHVEIWDRETWGARSRELEEQMQAGEMGDLPI